MPCAVVPLLGPRRVPTEFTVSSSSSSAVPGGGQEGVTDPTIASLVNATANEQVTTYTYVAVNYVLLYFADAAHSASQEYHQLEYIVHVV